MSCCAQRIGCGRASFGLWSFGFWTFPAVPNIARTKPRPAAPRSNLPVAKTKILLVRQPVKSVRKSDEPDRAMLRLMYGVVSVVGALALLWLMGYLGFRLGFAPMMRVPDLMVEGAGGLVAGAMMFMSLPQTILQCGIEQPMGLMLGFVLIALPAAILGAVKPVQPGGPRPKPEIVALSMMGAIAAALNAAVLVWWTISPLRAVWIADLPFLPNQAAQWLTNLQIVGGLDALGAVSGGLWTVVVMRLAIPLWLRTLTAGIAAFGLAVILLATAMSNVSVSQITAGRSVFFIDDGSLATHLVIGHTPQAMATLRVGTESGGAVLVDVRTRPADFAVIGQESVVEFLRTRRQEE